MDKIDRRILKSRQAIQSTFLDMLDKEGFDEITVRNISEKANIGRKTFYLHFMDKYDLLDKIVDEHITQLQEICDQKKDIGLMQGSILWFYYFEQHKSFFAALFKSRDASSFRNKLLSFTIGELNKKLNVDSQPIIDKPIFLKFLGTATMGVLESYVLDEVDSDIETVATQVAELYKLNIQMTFPNIGYA
ncbi:TetR/AcrR family transcriptional regulator [Cohnella thailandensis]|uniref:TetR/AcrR family transcriptional regulator C-terminal domain-containing protein n=1 Tax=Cohnella thailandensis TaxID=557557 RepID=A0A841SW90_9BACL|nr:TetR family transcriptional regulator [Cohnella thailandensis]MBB6634130.1 TetR/AcrR family transcriptional regulator C-terminal domain-containing protein [Cohnella thailandensis]MBP1972377.1 AcrR family transcriptional regulator [Cohnella thailandensis]